MITIVMDSAIEWDVTELDENAENTFEASEVCNYDSYILPRAL